MSHDHEPRLPERSDTQTGIQKQFTLATQLQILERPDFSHLHKKKNLSFHQSVSLSLSGQKWKKYPRCRGDGHLGFWQLGGLLASAPPGCQSEFRLLAGFELG